ncbi:sulfotransferase family 2 domain-containing protein [Maritimibacter fusiformis]|uniref:Sulfotransferase family protein n=1 Tax=Maritimibacter fusiformis TaxID=2603819 RepID=A0A5D0RI70_9RHOB|nr:sulfotransferase family 2 domain-containing protein [Maritimibacter fusiformis]TYB80485.1 sulfotransferase family protein [Maritimibacter fusiformis]
MILSRGRRYIFVHAPKTGGTSLALALEARAMADDIMLGDTPKARRRRGRVKDVATSGRLWKHSMLTDLYGLVTQDEIEAFFVFTLVRNPWDRMVSYYHWLREQTFDHPAVGLAQRLSFSDFLHTDEVQAGMREFPYSRYVRDARGVDRADLYIRLEHLKEDLVPLERHLGFNLGEIPHENFSNRLRDHRAYYSDRDVDCVRIGCELDILAFGYRFG